MSARLPSVPHEGVNSIRDEVQKYGRIALETGGFLLRARDEEPISVAAMAGTAGITRRWNLFEISATAIDRLFTHASDHDLLIPIQFHSHKYDSFLSETDSEHGFNVEDFVSVVIPNYIAPSVSVSKWGWWRFSDGRWVEGDHSVPIIAPCRVIYFDEDGVRGG